MSDVTILSKETTKNLEGKLETEHIIQNDVRMSLARFTKKYTDGRIHSIHGEIYFASNISGNVSVGFPLMIALWEQNDDFNLLDVYDFTKNGDCLVHRYSKSKYGQQIGETQQDTDISRLELYKDLFKQALDQIDAEPELVTHTAIMDLFYS